MAWRQIPHPPDFAFPNAGGDRIALSAGHVRVEWDRETGRVVELRGCGNGSAFLGANGPGITFRLLSADGLWIDGAHERAASVEQVSEDRVEVLYVHPRQCGVTFPVRLLLVYELTRDEFGPHLRCGYELTHEGGDLIVERVQFPVLSGLTEFAGPATELVLPFIGGERRPAPVTGGWSDFEYIYPNEAMSWMLLHDGQRGLSLASEDPAFRWTVLRGRVLTKRAEKALELLFETCPYLRAGQTASSQPFVLYPYDGTWHRAADRYRAWLETWWQAPVSSDWVKELRALVELFFEMPYADGHVDRFEAERLLAYMRRCHAELGFDIAHVCGYHEGGFDAHYPLYRPLERIGGEAGLREFLAHCNAEPGWTTDIYVNCRITDIHTEWWGETGRHWACVGKDGTLTTEFYNGQYFTAACPSIPARQDYWCATVDRLTRGYGSEGLQVDQPHTTAREDWAFEAHGHDTPFDHWGPGYMELFRRIREQLTGREPRVWSWGEAASDVFSQYFDFSCCYVRYPDQRVAFGETDPATRDWVHDWRGFGMPEVFRYVCPEVPMIQCPRIFADDPADLYDRLHILFAYSPTLYWPSLSTGYDLDRVSEEFRAYLRRLWELRHDLRDTMIHGRFRDTVGVSADPPGLFAKAYVSGPGRRPGVTVVAIHRDRQAALEAAVAVDPARLLPTHADAEWRWRECAGEESLSGSGLRAEVRIAPNGMAVLHYEPAS